MTLVWIKENTFSKPAPFCFGNTKVKWAQIICTHSSPTTSVEVRIWWEFEKGLMMVAWGSVLVVTNGKGKIDGHQALTVYQQKTSLIVILPPSNLHPPSDSSFNPWSLLDDTAFLWRSRLVQMAGSKAVKSSASWLKLQTAVSIPVSLPQTLGSVSFLPPNS